MNFLCRLFPLLLALVSPAICASDTAPVKPGETASVPYPGVRYIHRHTSQPREIDMHIVVVDLKRPGLTIRTTAGNADRPGETDLETTSHYVQRQGAQIGINGGFFGRSIRELLLGTTDLCSLAVSEGIVVSEWGAGQKYAIDFSPDNTPTIVEAAGSENSGTQTEPPIRLYNALSGNCRLLKNGAIVAKGWNPTYPQTAIGYTDDCRLILFVSDGRQPGFSAGMAYPEVAEVLQEFGATDAIALDGGGSATLVIADPASGAPIVRNRPSDGIERLVGNHLAIILNPMSGQEAKPARP